MQKNANTFDGTDFRNAGRTPSSSSWQGQVTQPNPQISTPTQTTPTGQPQQRYQPQQPSGAFDFRSPQGFAQMSSMFRPITQSVLGYGGVPALMGIYGMLTNNANWQGVTTRNPYVAAPTRLLQREVTAGYKFPLPEEVDGKLATPRLEKRSLGPAEWGLIGAGLGGAAGAAPALLSKKKRNPLLPGLLGAAIGGGLGLGAHHFLERQPQEGPVNPQHATAQAPALQAASQAAQHGAPQETPHEGPGFGRLFAQNAATLGGAGIADAGALGAWNQLAARAPGLGRAGGAGAVLPGIFALDAADLAGVNPFGERPFGSGLATDAELRAGGEDLANSNPAWRAFSGATQPLTTIERGRALGEQAGRDVLDAAGSNRTAQNAWNRNNPGAEPNVEHTPETNQAAQNIMTPSRWLTSPFEQADSVASTYLGTHDTAIRHHDWFNWADREITRLTAARQAALANNNAAEAGDLSRQIASVTEQLNDRAGPLNSRRFLASMANQLPDMPRSNVQLPGVGLSSIRNIGNSVSNRQFFNPLRDNWQDFRLPWQE